MPASLVASLGVMWAIWGVPIVMTNDGPQAVLTAHMESHYDDPDSIYARQLSVGLGLGGRGFSVLYRPIAELLPWPDSLRLCQLVIVLSLALAVGLLAKAISGRARLPALLGFSIAFSWPFYMGFYAFSISMAVGLMLVAFVVSRRRRLTPLEKAAVSTALLVQVFMHGFTVFITLMLVALVVMARAWMRRTTAPTGWRSAALRDAAWLVISAIPSVAVLLVMRTAQAEMAELAASGHTEWASPSESVGVLPRLVVPGSTPLGIVVFGLAWVGIARTALRLRRGPRRPEELALVIGAAGLLVAALTLPLNVPGWQFFAPRFLTTGLAVALGLLASEPFEESRTRSAFEVGVVALVGLSLVSVGALNQRLATACEDALAGLDHRVARSSYQLPVVLDLNCGMTEDDTRLDVPYARPLMHFYALFPVAHGGTVPYGFVGPTVVHAFVPRASDLPIPPIERYWGLSAEQPPGARAALLTELAAFGAHYENIVLFGANSSDRALLLDRGYVIDFEHGSFVNAHYTPCAVKLTSDVLPTDPPLMVRAGLLEDELWTADIAPVRHRPAIEASLSMLCGDAWVRIQWQDSALSCANADARGRIALRSVPGTTTRVVCERGDVRGGPSH